MTQKSHKDSNTQHKLPRAVTHPETVLGNPIPTNDAHKLFIDTYIKTRSIKKANHAIGNKGVSSGYKIYHKFKGYIDEVIDNVSDCTIADVREIAFRLTNSIQADLNDFIDDDGKWNLKAIKDSQDSIKDITFDDKGNIIKISLFNKLDSMKQLSTLLGYDRPKQVDVAVDHVYNFTTTQVKAESEIINAELIEEALDDDE